MRLLALFLVGCSIGAASQSSDLDEAGEARMSAKMQSLSEAELRGFLQQMPKGADLHSHLTGAVYAESYIEWAKSDGLCVDAALAALPKTKCEGQTAVADMAAETLVSAWSMEGFVPSAAETGHDHFFSSFNKFGLVTIAHMADSVREVAARAAAEHTSYLELMVGLTATKAGKLAETLWPGELAPENFAALREKLRAAPQWSGIVADGAMQMVDVPDVTVRYIMQATRTKSPVAVFAQLVAAHDIAARDHRLVGVNLVGAEDHEVALRDYALHMAMVEFTADGSLHVSLHAGELHQGEGHVRAAVEAGAERVGHAIAVTDDDIALLKQRQVLVEICLASNKHILDIEGSRHPLRRFLDAGVAVALATDDQGVSRSDMTQEWVRGVTSHQLTYHELKQMARASIQHAFLPAEEKQTLAERLEADFALFESN